MLRRVSSSRSGRWWLLWLIVAIVVFLVLWQLSS
jgi:hypothetical protein